MPSRNHLRAAPPWPSRLIGACALALAALAARAPAQTTAPNTDTAAPQLSLNPFDPAPRNGVYAMSLEDLMNVEVSSVSKMAQNISQAPAAITVIDQDQIHRSGMTSVPDLLRLVPGMDVAQVAPGKWAISARGFNSQYADKLLVLMDGRTIYDPLFSGVFWDRQDYILADLEKIEVIRGPGATMWGSNAVNGVINITTKSARDTQGFLIDAIGGTLDNGVSLRYGGKIGASTYYRIYGKFANVSDFQDSAERHLDDGYDRTRTGFRTDTYADAQNAFTLQGDYQYSAIDPNTLPLNMDTLPGGGGGNLLGRWTHTDSPESGFSLQLYYDHLERFAPQVINYHHDAVDLDFQQHFPLGASQEITWGFGARGERAAETPGMLQSLLEDNRIDYITNTFLQDDITLLPKHVHMILGSKFTYSSYDQFQVDPTARMIYTPDERNTFWGAISRATHTPGLGETDGLLQMTTYPIPKFPGNPDLRPEVLTAYELGYRCAPMDNLTLDLAGYYNRYERLLTLDLSQVMQTGNVLTNDSKQGHSYGAELAATYKITPAWRLAASYSVLHIQTDALFPSTAAGTSPKNQAQLHSYYDFTDQLSLNVSAYYVGGIVNKVAGADQSIKPYVRLDVGLSWRPAKGLEIGIDGQNLLQSRHEEFTEIGTIESVPRSAYVHLSYSF